uniref:IPT/TIG domain-containing protein n=1 Tax=candidate division CPR3 bacterium TaxID=2268181 RepID=A0A7V3JA74_UNCC3
MKLKIHSWLIFAGLLFAQGSPKTQVIDLPAGSYYSLTGQRVMTLSNGKIYTLNVGGQVTIINLKNRSIERTIEPDEAEIFATDLCASEELGVVLPSSIMYPSDPTNPNTGWVVKESSAAVRFLDPQSGRVVHKVRPSPYFSPNNCAIRADGKLVVTSSLKGGSPREDPTPKIAVIKGNIVEGFVVESLWPTNENSIDHILCLKTENKCYFTTKYDYGRPEIWSLTPSGPKKLADLPRVAGEIVASPDEKKIFMQALTVVLNTTTDSLEEFPFMNPPPILAFSGDSSLVYWFYTNFGYAVDLGVQKIIPGFIFQNPEGEKTLKILALRQQNFDLLAILRNSSLVFVEVPRKPMIHAVVNGASFQPGPIAPGEWISLFGSSLSFRTVTADKVPLPTELKGTKVWIQVDNNQPLTLPFIFVSLNQVNAQFPIEVPAGSQGKIWVEGPGNQKSDSTTFSVVSANPALFTYQGEVIIQNSFNGWLLNNVQPGQIVTLYATGLGEVQPLVASGIPAPFDPLAWTINKPEVFIGGRPCEILFSGLSPGWVGLYQINLRIPLDVPPGKQSLVIKQANSNSPEYNITISASSN